MIEAERLLLASALEDHSNQRFVLLSDRFASFSITLSDHLMPDHLLHLTLSTFVVCTDLFHFLLLSVLQMCSII